MCNFFTKIIPIIIIGVNILIIILALTGLFNNIVVRICCCIALIVQMLFITFNEQRLRRIINQLQITNNELHQSAESIEVSSQIIKDESDKLRKANVHLLEIQRQSQNLVTSLMESGDRFSDFGATLEETTRKNLSLVDKLSMLTRKLTIDEFKKIDKNGDGVITLEELTNY